MTGVQTCALPIYMDEVPLSLFIYSATHQHIVNRNDDKLFPYPGQGGLTLAAKRASFPLEAITIYMLKQGSSLFTHSILSMLIFWEITKVTSVLSLDGAVFAF